LDKITAEFIRDFLKDKSGLLTSTHHKLSLPIINRIYQKMIHNIKFDEIKVCDNLIIDGHHRYLSSLIANYEIKCIPSLKTSAIKEFLWIDVEFDQNDWDTESKIQYLNERDAEYNHIDIETINKINSI
jgi:hypothetical protein